MPTEMIASGKRESVLKVSAGVTVATSIVSAGVIATTVGVSPRGGTGALGTPTEMAVNVKRVLVTTMKASAGVGAITVVASNRHMGAAGRVGRYGRAADARPTVYLLLLILKRDMPTEMAINRRSELVVATSKSSAAVTAATTKSSGGGTFAVAKARAGVTTATWKVVAGVTVTTQKVKAGVTVATTKASTGMTATATKISGEVTTTVVTLGKLVSPETLVCCIPAFVREMHVIVHGTTEAFRHIFALSD